MKELKNLFFEITGLMIRIVLFILPFILVTALYHYLF